MGAHLSLLRSSATRKGEYDNNFGPWPPIMGDKRRSNSGAQKMTGTSISLLKLDSLEPGAAVIIVQPNWQAGWEVVGNRRGGKSENTRANGRLISK